MKSGFSGLITPLACSVFLMPAFPARATSLRDIHTVFVIVMENHPWSAIKDNTNCPYINNVLLPMASHCEQYHSPSNLHPTLPNYLWLVSGTNFGILDDNPPSINVQDTTNHLAYYLEAAGLSWKTYLVGLAGLSYPPTNTVWPYHIAFNPFLYFLNILTNTDYCRSHMRPYEELAGDLTNQTVANFNLIAPGLCYSMHDCSLLVGDTWLSTEVPRIMASPAYQNGGAIFVTWDEDDFTWPGNPTGMMVVSPLAKGGGYQNTNYYTHSSTLRTIQDIFGLKPYLGDAVNAANLSDLFNTNQFVFGTNFPSGPFTFTCTGLTPNQPYYLQASTNLAGAVWLTLSTNVSLTGQLVFSDPDATNFSARFYRLSLNP
jgi:hypothetical protein